MPSFNSKLLTGRASRTMTPLDGSLGGLVSNGTCTVLFRPMVHVTCNGAE